MHPQTIPFHIHLFDCLFVCQATFFPASVFVGLSCQPFRLLFLFHPPPILLILTRRPEKPLTPDSEYELILIVTEDHIDASTALSMTSLDYRWFSNLISQGRQCMALEMLPDSVVNSCFLHLIPDVLQSPAFTSPSKLLQSIFSEISFEYNASQQKAILTAASMIQSSISPKITMVQGPPGTGKSHTIVGLLCLIFDPRLHMDAKYKVWRRQKL